MRYGWTWLLGVFCIVSVWLRFHFYSDPSHIPDPKIKNASYGDPEVNSLAINYQELFIRESGIDLSWFGNSICAENVEIQGHTVDTGSPVLSQSHVYMVENSNSIFINRQSYSNTSEGVGINYRIIASSADTEAACPDTRNNYYRFNGIHIETPFQLLFLINEHVL